MSELTHVREDGSAHMVDVTGKNETSRTAVAEGFVKMRGDVVKQLFSAGLPKGDALPVARIAGIMGAKKTPDIIPLCHPLPLGKITVDFFELADGVRIEASVKTGYWCGNGGVDGREHCGADGVRHDQGCG